MRTNLRMDGSWFIFFIHMYSGADPQNGEYSRA
jgi:hypothetical protein